MNKKNNIASNPTSTNHLQSRPAPTMRRNMIRDIQASNNFPDWIAANPPEEGRYCLKFFVYIFPVELADVYEVVKQGLLPNDVHSASEVFSYLVREGAKGLLSKVSSN